MKILTKKTVLALALIFLGVCAGWLVYFAYITTGGKVTIAAPFLAAAIACIIAGTIIGFSRLLDRYVNPALDEIHKDLEDDIRDLQEHRITNPIWMVIITVVAALAFSFFVFALHKVEARWGAFPVIIPTFVGMAALAWFILKTRWFQKTGLSTPMGVFLIPTVGFIITLSIGLAKTEDLSKIRTFSFEPAVRSPAGQLTGVALQEGAGFVVPNLSIPSCSDDACIVFLVVALVILAFVLVIGSAFIPHFWLLSGSIFLLIMVLIAIHDLRIRRSTTAAVPKTQSGQQPY